MPLWCGVGITVITQPAVNGEWGGGIYFNSNTDLRREEKLENSDANPTFQEQHNCKYSLSRPKRQADYMHHVETFTNSIKFFQALFLEVSLRCKVFHQRNVHFIGHLRAIISQIPPLAHPPSPKYSSTFFLVITFLFFLLLLRLLVQLPTSEQPKLPLECLDLIFLGIREVEQ